MGFAYKGTYFIRPLTCFWRKCTIFVAQTRCQKAYLSRVQQQERLAIRYLKIGLSAQSPYYKGIKIIFQIYQKSSERTNKKEVNAAEWLINERFVLLCL